MRSLVVLGSDVSAEVARNVAGVCEGCRFWGWPGKFQKLTGEWVPYGDGERRDCQAMSEWPFFNSTHPLGGPFDFAPSVAPFAGADYGALKTPPDFGCNLWQLDDQ